MSSEQYDAIIIGGGFYGCNIALFLRQYPSFKRILLIEREDTLLAHASFYNQACVHRGYHYPRSLLTASRSQSNAKHFEHDYRDAIVSNYPKLYAIAKYASKINATQFRKVCLAIGAKVDIAPAQYQALFNPELIDAVYLTEEYAFDATIIREQLQQSLDKANIDMAFQTEMQSLYQQKDKQIELHCLLSNQQVRTFKSQYVFNCTYSGINQIIGDMKPISTHLKYELAEVALVNLPESLNHLSMTVMDGPFFSLVPFVSKNAHALTHVRYTPHGQWTNNPANPYAVLKEYAGQSRFQYMLHDAKRYVPDLEQTSYQESFFEIKAITYQNENDDGRPIVFEKHKHLHNVYSILGSKIDHIYDVLHRLEQVIM